MSTKKIIYGSWANKIVSSDLEEERKTKDWGDIKENGLNPLTDPWAQTRFYDSIDLHVNDPVLRNTHKYYEMTREEMFDHEMKKLKRVYEVGREKWFTKHEPGQIVWCYGGQGQSMSSLSQTMFILALSNLANDEQSAKWLPLAKDMKIIGAYAQTELGHGSDVASLETLATLDKETDEFVIHTPDDKAVKWWPGDIGLFCSHAIVFAKMVVDGNAIGTMPFFVQLRDVKTWKPAKGIELGDMGPKLGYTSKSNGWARFTEVRIPRENLLSRYVSVDKEGNFSIEGDPRMLYSVMMDIRLQLVQHSGITLGKAALLTLRYSAVRRQFRSDLKSKKTETKLIDYQTQQQKLFPLAAIGLAFLMAHAELNLKYMRLIEEGKKGNFEDLEECHHLTSGMKSVFTQTAMEGILKAREAVGGAGYSAWSGLPYLIDDFSPCVTFEGDNTVMAQQSAKFIIKQYKAAKAGKKLTGIFEYFNDLPTYKQKKLSVSSADALADYLVVDEIFRVCSLSIIEAACEKMAASKASKKEKTNYLFANDLVRMAQCHIKYVTFKIYITRMFRLKDQNLIKHLKNNAALMGLTFLTDYKYAGYEAGYLGAGSSQLLDEAFNVLLKRLRPVAIPLVELYEMPDEYLMSAIGNSYGDIYETHYRWAKESRFNTGGDNIPKGWKETILPLMNSKM